MAGFQTPVVTSTMTAAGAGGYITVADNSRFLPNAEAWLNHAGTITNVIITDLLGPNQIGVKIKPGSIQDATAAYTGPNYGKMNTSAYVVGDTITMPAQFVADATAPVAPNTALLLDQTSGVAALNDSLIIDCTNWSSVSIMVVPSGGAETAFIFYMVDDAGAPIQVGTIATPTANTLKAWGLGAANGVNGPLPRRIRVTSGVIAAQTTRLLIYGRK